MMMTRKLLGAAAIAAGLVGTALAAEGEPSVEHGQYVATIGGCNDCHTPGYPESGGKVPVSLWLTGVPVGFRGPWGTTYPTNLRLFLSERSEDEWVEHARTFETRPPMPWFNLHVMTETDLRSFYRFVRSLGEPGQAAPDYVPPDQEPKTPFIVFVPATPK